MVKKLNSHNDSTALQSSKKHFDQKPIEVARWDDHDVDFEILRRKNCTDSAFIETQDESAFKLETKPLQ